MSRARRAARGNPDWKAEGYIGAGIVIVNEFGLVLGITRGQNMADIGLPGGKADDADPTLQYAAARETYEETGVLVDPQILVYVDENPGPRGMHVAFFAPKVKQWPQRFGSEPFEGYVAFYQPEAFLNPKAPYREYTGRVFAKLGLV